MTEVRYILHNEIIPRFITYLNTGDVVYEIGKGEYDYKETISNLITLDREGRKHPDIEVDIEQYNDLMCDAVMCVGVTEECNNPFELIKGVHRLLNINGIVLFGIALVGNPVYDKDYWRFTANGAVKLIEGNFNIVEQKFVEDKYAFFIARKI